MKKQHIIRGRNFGKTRYIQLLKKIESLEEENKKLSRRVFGVETSLDNIKRRREKRHEDYGWPQK